VALRHHLSTAFSYSSYFLPEASLFYSLLSQQFSSNSNSLVPVCISCLEGLYYHNTGISQSVLTAMGYAPEVHSLFTGRGKKYFSNPHSIRTGYGAHIISYLMSTGPFPRRKSGRNLKLTTYLHLVSKSRMVTLYTCTSTPSYVFRG
jgi:hypothetical protein